MSPISNDWAAVGQHDRLRAADCGFNPGTPSAPIVASAGASNRPTACVRSPQSAVALRYGARPTPRPIRYAPNDRHERLLELLEGEGFGEDRLIGLDAGIGGAD